MKNCKLGLTVLATFCGLTWMSPIANSQEKPAPIFRTKGSRWRSRLILRRAETKNSGLKLSSVFDMWISFQNS
jgi:hypothetical protein